MLKSLFRAITGLIILGAAAQCSAGRMDTVWITGEVGFSCGTGTGGFEKYCSDGENIERGSFSLTYELSGRDSDLSEDRGFFRSAIKSFEMTVSQINRPHLYFSLVGHGDLQRSGNDWVWWQMKLAEENGVVAPSSFMFGLTSSSCQIQTNCQQAIFGHAESSDSLEVALESVKPIGCTQTAFGPEQFLDL